MKTQNANGDITEAKIAPNSTVIAPPGTIWMVENTGKVDLQVLVVIGCEKPGIMVYEGWNASKPAVTMDVMAWNQQCPPPLDPTELRVIT